MKNWESCFTVDEHGRAFKCSKCETVSKLYIPNKLEIFACPKCGTIHSRDHFEKYLKLPNQNALFLKYFKIGTVGTYDGIKYTVIGQVAKRVTTRASDMWDEIILLSETGEISFLNCSYGNYTWVKPHHNIPAQQILTNIENTFEFEGRHYSFFQGYNYKSKHCIGEFPYNLVDVKKINCSDYIAPPYVISIEKNPNGKIDCYLGQHMTRKEVSKMFNDYRIESQEKEGIGIAQPVLGNIDVGKFRKFGLLTILLIVVASIFSGNLRSNRTFIKSTLDLPLSVATSKNPEFISKSFYLDSMPTGNYLEFSSYVHLSNEWVELGLTLINEATGEEREFGVVSEYYSGVDDGYSWSEGEETGTVGLSEVPGGKYHLKGTIYSSVTVDKTIFLSGRYGGTELWNTLILVIPLLVLIIMVSVLKRNYEQLRRGERDTLFGLTDE